MSQDLSIRWEAQENVLDLLMKCAAAVPGMTVTEFILTVSKIKPTDEQLRPVLLVRENNQVGLRVIQ